MRNYAFGIDVGGTTIKFGLFKEGVLQEKWNIPTPSKDGGKFMVKGISDSLKSKMAEHKIEAADVIGAGVGVPGAVHSGGYLEPCVNINGWGGSGLEDSFEGECGFPFKLVNDANAAGLGEMREGGGKGHKNVIFVTLGTGVGGGIIIDGILNAGAHGCGGEIGHIHVKDDEERSCGCGHHGCLEQYASATGIVASAKMYLESHDEKTKLRDMPDFECADIFNLAKEGDVVCFQLVNDMTTLLGKVLAGLACSVNPEVIVIGGGVSKAGDILLDGIKDTFRKYAFASSVNTEIVLAQLGNDAGIYGGLEMAERSFSEQDA